METILNCKNISKTINKNKILDNVSLEIKKGDVIGLLGPNGAGKTTLIKSILSLNNIDKGSISICGFDIKKNYKDAIKDVGAIVETPVFYNYLSGRKNLKLKSRIYNVNDEYLNNIINLLGLNNYIDKKVYKYSLGMKQRLGIALSLVNNPKLLILDEPTNGLDIEGIKIFKELIIKLSKTMTIIISSHMLSILDNICNKICLIKNGRVISTGEIDKLKKLNNNNTYIFKVSDTSLINLTFKTEIIDNNTFKVECNKEFIPLIIDSLIKYKINIYEIIKEELTLENLFIKLGGLNEINTK